MQALLLAAGMGKRLGRYTNDGTKCMVRVNGISLIERTISALVACNIQRFVIVVGYKGDILKEFIAQKFSKEDLHGMEIVYIENTVYDKTNNIYSLFLARKELEKDETILLESDIIFKTDILQDLIHSPDKNIALVSRFEPWMDGTCALLDSNHYITGIIDKQHFNWNDTSGYHKTVNIYKLSRDFSAQFYIPFLEAYQKAFGKNEYYETVLKVLTFLDAHTLKACIVSGSDWYEIDDPEDLAIAENKFAGTAQKRLLMEKRYGGYWRFPDVKDFCYLVNPFFPTQNMDDELKASFSTLLRAYPSGAQEQSLLAGKLFSVLPEHIVVGNGAAELIHSYGSLVTGTIAIPYPTFNEYPARFCHAQTVEIPVNVSTFEYTAEDILTVVDTFGAQHVLLINPDNPSGHFFSKESVLSLLEALKKQAVNLIFDESFIDFADKDLRYTLIDDAILSAYPNLTVIKSISKSYGVPGLRLGVLASARTEVIAAVKKENAIWNINSFGEYFMQIFGKYEKDYKKACDLLAQERNRFAKRLAGIRHLRVFPSQANFIMCALDGTMSAAEVTQAALQEYSLLIKDLSAKQGVCGRQCIRLAIMRPQDNDFAADALQQLLER
mgnify:CR=1 FL=1